MWPRGRFLVFVTSTLRPPTSDLSWKPFETLREHMVKVIHLFTQVQDVISMFPFLALSVFNFYVSKTELFMQDMSMTEPKVESVNDLRSKR